MTRPPITPDPPDPVDHETPLEELNRLLRDERRRWRARFVGVALIVLIGAAFLVRTSQVATEAKAAAVKAQEAVDLVVAQRAEARVTACEKDKRFAIAHNNLVNFFLSVPDNDPDPVLRKRFEDENIVPVPDCSPAGIAATYPAVPKSKK